MISEYTINRIKSTANVADVLADYLPLKKKGNDYECSCPFHEEKTPSFVVSRAKNIYKCFGSCSAQGDSIEFVMKYKSVTFTEAIQILAKKYNIEIENTTPQPKREYKRPQQPKFALSDLALTYLSSRKISPEICQQFKVSTTTEWMFKAKAEVECICFNYFRGDELINIKYRAKDKDFKLAKDAELIFYNLNSLKSVKSAVIVEGEIDALSVAQSALEKGKKIAVVSVPNGANVNGIAKLEYVDNCYKEFEHLEQIVIFTDNDDAGKKLRDELGRRFGYHRCLMVTNYFGFKDANEILNKKDAQSVLDAILTAVEFPINGVLSVDDVSNDVLDLFVKGFPENFKSNIPNLDIFIKFVLGQFTTITGVPGSGKSEFLDYLVTMIAMYNNFSVGVFSHENQPVSLHVTKIMQKHSGKAFFQTKKIENRMSVDEYNLALNFVSNHFYFVNIFEGSITIDGILDRFKELVYRRGIRIGIIDPWNCIEHNIEKGVSETNYISKVLSKISMFCKIHQVHIFLVAHPTKMSKVNNKYEIPNMYSISGSANFFNKTDNGLCVNRDGEIVTVYIQKVKNEWNGKLGACDFGFDLNKRQYLPIMPPIIVDEDEEDDPFKKKEPPPPPDNPRAGISQATRNTDIPF